MERSAIDRTGQSVANRYQIQGILSEGSLATVYSANAIASGETVAIKILNDEVIERGSYFERFEREHLVCSRMQSPLCLRMLEFGSLESGVPFQVMEYVPGESLADILDRQERLPVDHALVLFSKVLEALMSCSDAGIIHRDVKPENFLVFLDAQGVERVKLIGFGIAKLIGQAAKGHDRLTSIGLVLGTPHYIAPEWVSSDNVDARADLYSATVMLFEMLTSAPPFLHEDKREIMTMHLRDAPPSLAARVPGEFFAPQLEALIVKGLAKMPKDRFAGAREYLSVLAMLNPALGIVGPSIPGQSVPMAEGQSGGQNFGHYPNAAVPPGPGPTTAAPFLSPPEHTTATFPQAKRKSPKMMILGGVLAASVLGLVAVVVLNSSSSEDATPAEAKVVDAGGLAEKPDTPVVPDKVEPPEPPETVSKLPISDKQVAKVTRLWTKGRMKVSGFTVGPQDKIANGACRYGQVDSINILLCSASLDPVASSKKMKRSAAGSSRLQWRARILRSGLYLRVEVVKGKANKKRRRKIENIFRKMS